MAGVQVGNMVLTTQVRSQWEFLHGVERHDVDYATGGFESLGLVCSLRGGSCYQNPIFIEVPVQNRYFFCSFVCILSPISTNVDLASRATATGRSGNRVELSSERNRLFIDKRWP